MKRLTTIAIILVAQASTSWAQEGHGPPALPQPSEQHQHMAADAGVWEGEMQMWMTPDAEPMTMPVTETNTMLDGGLWLFSDFQSGPYQGRGTFGYDVTKEKFVGTWVDNMSSHMSVMQGEMNEDGELVMYMTGVDPHTKKARKMKSVTKQTGEGQKEFTMYREGSTTGEWVKEFAINYSKKS